MTPFFDDAAIRLAPARDAVARGEASRRAEVVHQLRGSAMLIGAERVAQCAWQIEEAAGNAQMTPNEWRAVRLADEIERTRSAIDGLGVGRT